MDDLLPEEDQQKNLSPAPGAESDAHTVESVAEPSAPASFTYPPRYLQAMAQGTPTSENIEDASLLPNLLHTLLFFVIALVTLFAGQVVAAVVYHLVTLGSHPHQSLNSAFAMTATDPRISIPVQAAIYGVLVLVSFAVFTGLWMQPFWKTIEWNLPRARKFFFPLLGVGLLTGITIGAIGNRLPMPQSPPILDEMSTSQLGAWFMLIFGITAAPMTEELAFRGFLLPSLLNLFRLSERRGLSNHEVTRWVGIPVSILLTTIPFTLLHAQQVSDSWGPLVLIGLVSIVLCVVRLLMKSVACSAVVHAAYNFTLFAGVVYQTSGFEHLNKLLGS